MSATNMLMLVLLATLSQNPFEHHVLNEINRTRVSAGRPPFVWNERLANVARNAVANNWAYHQNFSGRLAHQGYSPDYSDRSKAEGSFPAQGPDQTIEGLMQSMRARANGPHGRDFFAPHFVEVGIAYGGHADPDQPFWVFVYSVRK